MLCFQIPLGALMTLPRIQDSGGLKFNVVLTRPVSSLRTPVDIPFVSSVPCGKCDDLGPTLRDVMIDLFG